MVGAAPKGLDGLVGAVAPDAAAGLPKLKPPPPLATAGAAAAVAEVEVDEVAGATDSVALEDMVKAIDFFGASAAGAAGGFKSAAGESKERPLFAGAAKGAVGGGGAPKGLAGLSAVVPPKLSPFPTGVAVGGAGVEEGAAPKGLDVRPEAGAGVTPKLNEAALGASELEFPAGAGGAPPKEGAVGAATATGGGTVVDGAAEGTEAWL